MREVANQQQGLYRPEFEHDNCGIGAVVNIKGKKTHDTVANALKIVERIWCSPALFPAAGDQTCPGKEDVRDHRGKRGSGASWMAYSTGLPGGSWS